MAFNGVIDETGMFIFQPLFRSRGTKQLRWTVFVRLVKISSKLDVSSVNWNVLHEGTVPISKSMIDGTEKIPIGTIAELWTEAGQIDGQITRSEPTYIESGKNIGKRNETNIVQQALMNARTAYNKKVTEGYHAEGVKVAQTRIYPMAAHDVEKFEKKLVFPSYTQRKFDGDRCMTQMVRDANGAPIIDMYSRRLKDIPGFSEIRAELLPAFDAILREGYQVVIDGELYRHGLNLQTITGIVRNEVKTEQLYYHIFDCYVVNNPQMPFTQRLGVLLKFAENIPQHYVRLVETYLVNNYEELKRYSDAFLREGYEGAMWRDPAGLYETSTDGEIRSYQLMKLKPVHREEFRVVGYTHGEKGRERSALIWELETPQSTAPNGGITPSVRFTSVPLGTIESRRELLTDAEKHFDEKYNGKMMTVEYRDKSIDGVPLRAKAVGFRDYE